MWELLDRVYRFFVSDELPKEDISTKCTEIVEDAMLIRALEEAAQTRLELELAQEEAMGVMAEQDAISSRLAQPITFAYGRGTVAEEAELEVEFAALNSGDDLELEAEIAALDSGDDLELEAEFAALEKEISTGFAASPSFN